MDLKYALRTLAKSWGFTLLAVGVLALGIGANSAIFSVINAVILQPLPYKNASRIVSVGTLWISQNRVGRNISAPDFHDWEHRNTVFEAMGYLAGNETSVIAAGRPDYANVQMVSPGFFRTLGPEPVRGRLFSAGEERQGGPPAAVISHGFWQRVFGGREDALGKTVKAHDRIFTIVGILPPAFDYPAKAEVWVTASAFEENHNRTAHNYRVIALLKPDVSLEQAETQMKAIAARLAAEYPENKDKSSSVVRLQDRMVSSVRATLYYLLGAVFVILLIACANVANLLLARANGRTREIAIRAALGAGRGRIVRQLIVESLVLASAAGLAGIVVAIWGKRALLTLAPASLVRLDEVRIDGWVLVFTFAMAVVSSLLFGVAPALNASRLELNEALKQGGTRTIASGGSGRLRQTLVVVEIALSIVLVAGAALLIKSFASMTANDLGFRPERLLVMDTSVPANDLEAAKRSTFFYRDLLPKIGTIPGVTSVSAAFAIPGQSGSNGMYGVDGQSMKPADMMQRPQAIFNTAASGYFKTLGLRLVEGRDFDDRDTFDAPAVAIVNEALAKQSFPNASALGHTIVCGLDRPVWMTIVGVVSDIRQFGPASKPSPEIVMPYQQHPRPSTDLSIVVRTSAEAGPLAETLRRVVREANPEVPAKFTTVEESLSQTVAVPRFRTTLLGIFAALALVLAMVGVYGVMAYMVGQRTAEIGVRMALGASRSDVIRMVLVQGGRLAAIGLALGLAASVAVNRTLESFLFEVKPNDPAVYATVACLMILAMIAACFIPAWRASKLDPLLALRQD